LLQSTEPDAPKRLTPLQLAAYAAPTVGFGLATAIVLSILPTLYAQHAQVSVAAIGTIVMLRLIYDAASDQIIGYLSDRTRSRYGARLPWIVGGSMLTLISMVYLFRIPADAGAMYFAFWNIVFFTGTTMFGIPHYAWGHELSPLYEDRSRVFGYRGFFDNAGGLLYSLVPLGLAFAGIVASSEYTPELVWIFGLIVIALIPLTVALATAVAPRGELKVGPRTTLRSALLSVKGNRPFQRFVCAYLIAGTGYGFFVALLFPFLTTYMKIADSVATIILIFTVSSLVSIPVWTKLTMLLGKHRAWAWGWFVNSLVLLPLFWIEPGPSSVVPTCVLMALYALTNGVSSIAPFAILSDIIDYDVLKTGVDRGGNYYGLMMMAVKALASTGGIALILLGTTFGYDMTEGHQNTPFANLGMLLMFVGAPALFQLATLPLIWNFPLDARRHAIISRKLAQRAARANRIEASGV
jgi:glycoside/pentoside/hexuronide:cation symporter, GPH family